MVTIPVCIAWMLINIIDRYLTVGTCTSPCYSTHVQCTISLHYASTCRDIDSGTYDAISISSLLKVGSYSNARWVIFGTMTSSIPMILLTRVPSSMCYCRYPFITVRKVPWLIHMPLLILCCCFTVPHAGGNQRELARQKNAKKQAAAAKAKGSDVQGGAKGLSLEQRKHRCATWLLVVCSIGWLWEPMMSFNFARTCNAVRQSLCSCWRGMGDIVRTYYITLYCVITYTFTKFVGSRTVALLKVNYKFVQWPICQHEPCNW